MTPEKKLSATLLCGACATRRIPVCGGSIPGKPEVTLESVTATKDSPASGYPVSLFPLPIYPAEFVSAGVTGEVTVRLIVGKDGHVKDTSIVKSSAKEFEGPVRDAMQSWRFQEGPQIPPAEPKGLIVDCTFKFSLE